MMTSTSPSHNLASTSMRILHAAKIYPPPFGGIETVLERLTHGLCELNPKMLIDIVATHPKSPSRLEFANQRLVINKLRSITQIARTPLAIGYRKMLQTSPADLFHFHFPYPWAELSYLTSGINRPYIISYHSDIVKQKHLLKLWSPFMNRFLTGANRVVVASPQIVESSPVLQNLPAEKISIIPYGIDTSLFSTTPESKIAAQTIHHRLAGPRPMLFFLGRLVYYKGVDTLIKAMKDIDAHLIIGGEGPLRGDLEQLVHSLALGSKITFIPKISPSELPHFFQASDLFILPSTDTSEAFGMVMLEAHASGIPVVSTNLPTGVVFVNQHDKTGISVTPRDPQALSMAIRFLLNNPEERLQMGIFAQKRAICEFDTKVMCKAYSGLYDEILMRPNL